MNKTLDILHSRYIKLLKSDEKGLVNCCYCGKIIYVRDSEAAHYITRNHGILRYNEYNVNPSCISCNRDDHTELYRAFLIKNYGIETVEYIESIKNNYFKLTIAEQQEMKVELRAKIRGLKMKKDFEA